MSSRRAALTTGLSLGGLPFILPHVLEDFAEGVAGRAGLTTATVAFLVGGWLALQSLGLVLVGRGRRAGWIITFGVSLVWSVVAVLDHGPAITAGRFRSGPVSILWVMGLVASQGATAVLAWRGWRRTP